MKRWLNRRRSLIILIVTSLLFLKFGTQVPGRSLAYPSEDSGDAKLLILNDSESVSGDGGVLQGVGTTPVVSANPVAVTINTQNCRAIIWSCKNKTERTVTVQTNVPLTNIQIHPTDLVNDNNSISSERITTPSIPTTVEAGVSSLTFEIDTTDAVPGTYTGSVTISYDKGSSIIPLTVNVKDNPLLPSILLIVFLILGILLAVFRQIVQPVDDMIIRIAHLAGRKNNDTKFQQVFGKPDGEPDVIDQMIVKAYHYLDDNKLEEAKKTIDEAFSLYYDKWLSNPEKWKELEDQRRILEETLGQWNERDLLRLWLRNVERFNLRNETLDSAKNRLDYIREKLGLLREGLNWINKIKAGLHQIDDDIKRRGFKTRMQRLISRLGNFDPIAEDLLEPIINDLATLLQEIEHGLQEQGIKDLDSLPEDERSPTLEPVELTNGKVLNWKASRAQQRRALFEIVGLLVLIIILVLTGYVNLYEGKSTFGAQTADYLTLITYGVSVEIASAAITGVDLSAIGKTTGAGS